MSSSPRYRSDFAFPWYVDNLPKSHLAQRLELFYTLCHRQWQLAQKCSEAARPQLARISGVFDQTVLATALIVLPKVFAQWDAIQPALRTNARALLPFLPLATPEEEALKQDPVWELLAEFQSLEPSQQDKVAKNLALLWGHFENSFGGLSGFLAEPATEQSIYLEKLRTASSRMRAARQSKVAFHYVSVEMMRQYVCGLHSGRSDRAALSLATSVAALINRGRMIMPAITTSATAG